jgi:hypothetical protein
MFENRMLKKIFGPKLDELTGDWRRLRNVELHDLYSSLNIMLVITSGRMRWVRHVPSMRDIRGAYRIFVA